MCPGRGLTASRRALDEKITRIQRLDDRADRRSVDMARLNRRSGSDAAYARVARAEQIEGRRELRRQRPRDEGFGNAPERAALRAS